MSDRRLRELERAAQEAEREGTGYEARAQVLREQERVGLLSHQRLRLKAALGEQAAILALGEEEHPPLIASTDQAHNIMTSLEKVNEKLPLPYAFLVVDRSIAEHDAWYPDAPEVREHFLKLKEIFEGKRELNTLGIPTPHASATYRRNVPLKDGIPDAKIHLDYFMEGIERLVREEPTGAVMRMIDSLHYALLDPEHRFEFAETAVVQALVFLASDIFDRENPLSHVSRQRGPNEAPDDFSDEDEAYDEDDESSLSLSEMMLQDELDELDEEEAYLRSFEDDEERFEEPDLEDTLSSLQRNSMLSDAREREAMAYGNKILQKILREDLPRWSEQQDDQFMHAV